MPSDGNSSQRWAKKRKTVDEPEYANYCQLSFKVKIN
jgi:hypothetical protein